MSKKIATFKDLDTLANLNTSTSAGYITGATDEQCVTKGNFDTVSTKTIAATGNGLMFVEGSESSKYVSNRLILLDDVQYISEITAELVSAPNIPAKGGESFATWKLKQYYKKYSATSPSAVEWEVEGSKVEASSKGTIESAVTNVAESTITVTKNGKSITLSQMIKQDSNEIKSYGDWTTPTVTVSPDSFNAVGGTATITISGDSTREKTWSSEIKDEDTADIFSINATLGTVSNDYKTLNIGLNDTSSYRSGYVEIKWSFDGEIVKTVKSNTYSQVAQSSSTLTLTGTTKTYDGNTSYVSAKASLSGTIYYGTSSGAMNNQIDVNVDVSDTVNLIECGRTSAGTTTVYAYLKPSSSDYSNSSTEQANIIINMAPGYLSATVNTPLTYRGDAHTIAAIKEKSGDYYFGISSSSEVAPNEWGDKNTNLYKTNAGTYYVWAKCDESTNYYAVEPHYVDTVTINKREVIITAPTATNYTYNGSDQTIFGAGSCTPGGTMYYSINDKEFSPTSDDWSTDFPYTEKTDAGIYTIYYYCYVSDTSNNTGTNINTKLSINAIISKKSTTAPTLTAGYKTTYDGSAVYAKAANASGNPAGKIYYGATSGAETYNITASSTASNLTEMGQTNVGKKTIHAFFRPNDTTNYDDSSIVSTTVEVTNKATPTIVMNSVTVSYNGSEHYIEVISDIAGTIYYGTSLDAMDNRIDVNVNESNTVNLIECGRTDAGITTVHAYLSPTDTSNYNNSDNYSATLKVTNEAVASVTVNVANNSTYNGYAQPIASATSNGVYTYTLGYATSNTATSNDVIWGTQDSDSLTATNAGTYYIWVKWEADTNHTGGSPDGENTGKKVTISQINVTYTATDQSKVYDDTALIADNTASLTSGTLVSDHTATFTCSGSITNYTANGAIKILSSVVVKSGSTDVTSNYNITKNNGKLTINKRNVTFKAEDESVEYTGSVLRAKNTASLTPTSATLAYDHKATFTCSGIGLGVEEYTKSILTVTIMSGSTDVTSNYNITKQSGKFVITQRTVTITAPIATNCTYSGSAQTIFAAGSCTTGGIMYYSDTDQDFSTSTWTDNIPYPQKTDAGTYTLYYYCYVRDIENNTGTNINTKLSISAIINKAPATISFSGGNLTVQCKNSDTLLSFTRDVQYLAAVVSGGSVSYTIDSITNPSGVTGTYISASPTTQRALRVAIDTPVGDYSVDITASQSDPNYTSTPVTRTYKISVLPDTLGDYTGTLSIDPSTKLSAGDDTRTITWGAIHQVWEHGGNKVYMPYTANLTVSCNDSTAKEYVSIDKNSYVNSSATTTTTLTKKTYGSVYEHEIGATFTLALRTYDGTIIKTLEISANSNNKIHTLTGVTLSYTNPANSLSGGTNIPTVTYNTSYVYQSGAAGSTTTGNTSTLLSTGTTFTKSFSIVTDNTAASLDTSTGVVTWNSANTSTSTRQIVVKCTGTLDSFGSTSSMTSTDCGAVQAAGGTTPTYDMTVTVLNQIYKDVSCTVQINGYELATFNQSGSANGQSVTKIYSGASSLTIVLLANSNNSGSTQRLRMELGGGGYDNAKTDFSPDEGYVTLQDGFTTDGTTLSVYIERQYNTNASIVVNVNVF